jgi:hypothetical protein
VLLQLARTSTDNGTLAPTSTPLRLASASLADEARSQAREFLGKSAGSGGAGIFRA